MKTNGQRQKGVSVKGALLEGRFTLGVPPRSYLIHLVFPWLGGGRDGTSAH